MFQVHSSSNSRDLASAASSHLEYALPQELEATPADDGDNFDECQESQFQNQQQIQTFYPIVDEYVEGSFRSHLDQNPLSNPSPLPSQQKYQKNISPAISDLSSINQYPRQLPKTPNEILPSQLQIQQQIPHSQQNLPSFAQMQAIAANLQLLQINNLNGSQKQQQKQQQHQLQQQQELQELKQQQQQQQQQQQELQEQKQKQLQLQQLQEQNQSKTQQYHQQFKEREQTKPILQYTSQEIEPPQLSHENEKDLQQNSNTLDSNQFPQHFLNEQQRMSSHEIVDTVNQVVHFPFEIDIRFLEESYTDFLQKIAIDQAFVEASYEIKIEILMEFCTSPQHANLRLGSLIFVFELLYNFRDSLTDSSISVILDSTYNNFPSFYESKDFYTIYASLEIITLIGPHEISYNNIQFLASILIDEAIPLLQDKAFLALMNLDYPGFFALLDIASKDYGNIPSYILNKLASTEEIHYSIIIPALQNEITSNLIDPKKRFASLCALNRMYSMIQKSNSLQILINLLNEGTLDKQLIVSTLRASGEQGEQILLNLLKETNNPKIKMAITTVLSWRVRSNEKSTLGIRIIPYNIASHFSISPGSMINYVGDMTPLAFVESNSNIFHQENFSDSNFQSKNPSQTSSSLKDFIEINSRDFMAALQRLLSVKFDKFNQQQTKLNHANSQSQSTIPPTQPYEGDSRSGFLSSFTLIKLIDPTAILENLEPPTITSNVIRALSTFLSDQDPQVRETSISTLGLIGYPEIELAIDSLYNSLLDLESQVRAMAAWCFGRIELKKNHTKVAKRLLSLLKDKYWKVRTAACISLGIIGVDNSNIISFAIPALTKLLKDGSVNRQTVCETLVRLGIQGEQVLVDLLRNASPTDLKLRQAIISSFELANITRPTIDFIVEELFKNSTYHISHSFF